MYRCAADTADGDEFAAGSLLNHSSTRVTMVGHWSVNGQRYRNRLTTYVARLGQRLSSWLFSSWVVNYSTLGSQMCTCSILFETQPTVGTKGVIIRQQINKLARSPQDSVRLC